MWLIKSSLEECCRHSQAFSRGANIWNRLYMYIQRFVFVFLGETLWCIICIAMAQKPEL